ncbi:ACP S-malonyltransferase [Actinosynnema sp. NPDC023658]|uniref:ACP S-malonyltransferase n=1 Tax=Actinosynnema sp. NPDC023658 TaxID=3155465 RepID=UPI0033C5F41F
MRCYVFPGQGAQKKGMGKAVLGHFPDLCRQADEVLGYSVEELCLEDPGRLLNRTEHAQPALYVVNALHYLAARRDGLPAPDYLAGHSLGEYNALFAAGAFDFVTGLALVRRRAELMGRAEGGAMAAVVGVPADVVEEALAAHGVTGVVIANYNAPDQFVLSGGKEELARVRPVLEAVEGVRGFVPLRVSGAFHSPHMAGAAREFRSSLEAVEFDELRTPVVSSVTGRPLGPDPDAVREALAEQITRPVRWTDCIRHLRDAGVSEFVELGGTKVLTSLVDKITAAEHHAERPSAQTTAPADAGPWLDYRDERVLALLRDCADGRLSVDQAIETIRAGGAGHR